MYEVWQPWGCDPGIRGRETFGFTTVDERCVEHEVSNDGDAPVVFVEVEVLEP